MRGYLLLPSLLSPLAQAMQTLDDASLSAVTGQDGITLETTGGGWGGANTNVDYGQDGQTLSLKGVSNKPQSGSSVSTHTIDVVGDQLQIKHQASPQVLSVDSIQKEVKGSYSFDGLRVGSATAPLQGGTELLVLMEVFAAYDFNLDGQLTILPGGNVGDGLRYNADFFVTEGNAALTVDEVGKGLWLAGSSYEMHYRGGSVDVTNNGIELRKGTYWSKLDV
ncbi:MAG: hypothetical protein ACI9EB_000581 [Pseudomonas sp.]|jgi:hypothetical protein